MYTSWIYIIAILITIPSAILGGFLLLRRSIMVSDAISHSILPGLVIGFLISKSLYSPILLIFASLFGVLTVLIIEWIHKGNKVKKDASIGLSYTFLFALGVIMIANFTSSNSDLHQDCILYGDIDATPWKRVVWFDTDFGPKAFWTLIVLNIIVFFTIIIGWKPLTLSSFDPTYSSTIGFHPKTWNYILMTLVSMCVVTAFDIVGAILIISLLAAPAATSFLFSKRIHSFFIRAMIIAVINTFIGIYISFHFNLIMSGTLALIHGTSFFLTLLGKKMLEK